MSAPLLAGLVALASYFTISTGLSAVVLACWRVARPLLTDANVLFALRLLPSIGGLLLTACLVAPAFLRFEPDHDGEQPGPLLLALSAAGLAMLAAGVRHIARAIVLTRRLRLRWLSTASALPSLDGRTPAHLIDVAFPVVAIIGIFRPVLVVSTKVAGGCSSDEVELIAAHERAHLRAGDNLKRLLVDGCPDILRWTATGRELSGAWAAAAEDEADDAATGGDRRARIAMASVLLRVARMAIGQSPSAQLASALVGINGVERRVRRLAETSGPPSSSARALLYAACGAAALVVAAAASNHDVLYLTYSAAEHVVGFGR